MAVLEAWSVTLDVPDLDIGVRFYTDAGLQVVRENGVAKLRCAGQSHPSILLRTGGRSKRLNHIALRCDRLEEIAAQVPKAGGQIVRPPEGFARDGLWLRDPHGMLLHLVSDDADSQPRQAAPFEINAPGRTSRQGRSAIKPSAAYPAVMPLRLGHILVFSPDIPRSVAFVTDALGMGLADHAQNVIAFCCARQNSDHHILAFAKSPGIGFHHASFQVNDPDEVGRGGRALLRKAGRGDWGFGRHTIGSNFFHYIQDPWGSWFEYYSDMDHIADYALWSPTNYPMEDSLANWGPPVPADFVHNYELSTSGDAGVPLRRQPA
jgi:catechol 2,3-dioxygenase-like lactoylglutathione lyase family enzyme